MLHLHKRSIVLKLQDSYSWSGRYRRVSALTEYKAGSSDCVRRDLNYALVLTDALLCHDDELEGRRIAFILYLVPSWDRDLGGTLDLYDTDGKIQLQVATPEFPALASGQPL